MKKFILYPLVSLLGLILLLLVGVFGILFFKPNLVLNPENLNWLLTKTNILKSWSWEKAEMDIHWGAWNRREWRGGFTNLCFEFENEALDLNSCLKKISWDFELTFNFKEGFSNRSMTPMMIRGERNKIVIKNQPGPVPEVGPDSPPNIWRYWKTLWSPFIPDLDFYFLHNEFIAGTVDLKFDVRLLKSSENILVQSLGFELKATPKEVQLIAPHNYKIPYDLKVIPPLHLYGARLVAQMKETGIPLALTGTLETVRFEVHSYLDLPIRDSFSSVAFRRKTLLATSARLKIENLQKNIKHFGPKPYNVMPAPLNEMNGDIVIRVDTEKSENERGILVKAITSLDLKSKDQVLQMDLSSNIDLNLKTFHPDSIVVGIDFNRVNLKLPRISKKSLPPQFLPDSRIKKNREALNQEKTPLKSNLDLSFKIEAEGEKALHLKSNLLDEALRLNLNLLVEKGNLREGYVKVLPLKTTVFKRKIRIPFLTVKFNYPKGPVLEGIVRFLLPQYKITMNLEGPISEPRFAFSSEPPLPQNDIYSVLLFGRTLADLDPDDKRAASQTNQLLANGVLSLSVLYFLSGSPIQYVGYDPDSKDATAQIGLTSKDSLRVGANGQGLNSTGIRHSVGKGWYIDTSAQSTQKSSNSTSRSTDYGVMLERIIAY